MNLTDLPLLNACLNCVSAILLTFGFINIKKGRQETHKKFMVSALITSLLFFTSYIIYHYNIGSMPYPYHDWTRTLYFAVLIPHVILAAINLPCVIILVRFAFKENFEKHKKLARIIWPVWMFVSVSGVVVYLMLYQL